jgi:hypothetical protein
VIWIDSGRFGAALDPDAAAYITAVEAADTQALEVGVKDAINDFVVGCKADGIWAAIKASCILAGARTLTGALVPLVGAAPTNVDGLFVSGDYNRKTGLVGNGSTKYLDSNRAGNADPQDNFHIAVNLDSIHTLFPAGAYAGNGGTGTGANSLVRAQDSAHGSRCRASPFSGDLGSNPPSAGLLGVSRSSSSSFITRTGATNYTSLITSESPFSGNYFIFCRSNPLAPNLFVNARINFYSIGESLDLAQLDTRLTALINAFAASIL